MRHRAIFCADQSYRCGDMAVFRFFKVAVVRQLGLVVRLFGPLTKSIWWSLSLCKICWNPCSSVDNMQVLIF